MRTALALLLLAGCGGSAPTTYPADSGAPDAYVAPDAAVDAGPCDCNDADGWCCRGCHLWPAGTACALERFSTSCSVMTANSVEVIARRWYCDGISAACVVSSAGGQGVTTTHCPSGETCVAGAVDTRDHCSGSADFCDVAPGYASMPECVVTPF